MKSLKKQVVSIVKKSLNEDAVLGETVTQAKYNICKEVFSFLEDQGRALKDSETWEAVTEAFQLLGYDKEGYYVREGFVCRDNPTYSVEIYPDFPSQRKTVTVYKPCERYGAPYPSEINFPCFGSSSAEEVAHFATALDLAVNICKELNGAKEVA